MGYSPPPDYPGDGAAPMTSSGLPGPWVLAERVPVPGRDPDPLAELDPPQLGHAAGLRHHRHPPQSGLALLQRRIRIAGVVAGRSL